jgi:hypothetical protein
VPRRFVLALVVVFALALHANAQGPPAPRGPSSSAATIAGRIVADESGDPLARARVAVAPSRPGAPVVLTDDDGRFSMATTSQRVTLTLAKAGYATTDVVAAARAPVEVRLVRGAAIEGRVVDELGDPAQTAVLVQSRSTPSRRMVVDTDDRGEYRAGGLPAGTYDVTVRQPAPRLPSGVVQSEAQTVSLQPGNVASDVDFLVRAERFADRLVRRSLGTTGRTSGTASIAGSVVTTGGRPVAHADVMLSTGLGINIIQETFADSNGRFAFSDLPEGTYTVATIKTAMHGGTLPSKRVSIADGATADVQIEIALERGAMEGFVSEEDGEPVQGVLVQALEVRYERGARRLVPSWSSRTTDDLGHYRLFGLGPGQYVVTAAPTGDGGGGGASLPGYPRSFYPGTTDASQAQLVAVAGDDTVAGINLSLTRGRTARVSGRLLDAFGGPTTGGRVSLVPSVRSASATMVPVGARIGSDGTFEFTGVAPGQYVVQMDRGRKGPSTEGEFGVVPVVVSDRDVTGVVVQAMPGSSIAGRVVLDSASGRKLRSASDIEINPVPVDFDLAPNQVASADIRDDGTFVMQGVTGPRRIAATRVPAGWMVEAVRVAGVDVTDSAIEFGTPRQSRSDVEVVLTDRVSSVAGTVTGARGAPAADVPVIVFPTDRSLRFFRSRYLATTSASADGTFAIAGLPPGSYYVAAVPPLRAGDADGWQDPQLLESFMRVAESIVVRDGETTSVSLHLAAP